jgi:hypothetical protein
VGPALASLPPFTDLAFAPANLWRYPGASPAPTAPRGAGGLGEPLRQAIPPLVVISRRPGRASRRQARPKS